MASLKKPVSRAAEKKVRQRDDKRQYLTVTRVVMQRDQYRCRHCRSTFMVEPHHIKFRSAGGGNSTANLAALCRPCHDEIHAYRLAVSGNADKNLRFEVLK